MSAVPAAIRSAMRGRTARIGRRGAPARHVLAAAPARTADGARSSPSSC
ncbi:hypothetical protein ACWEWG_23560 [Streptomyces sp. NPDC003758]